MFLYARRRARFEYLRAYAGSFADAEEYKRAMASAGLCFHRRWPILWARAASREQRSPAPPRAGADQMASRALPPLRFIVLPYLFPPAYIYLFIFQMMMRYSCRSRCRFPTEGRLYALVSREHATGLDRYRRREISGRAALIPARTASA